MLGRELKHLLKMERIPDDESGNLVSQITFCLTRPSVDDKIGLLEMPPLCYALCQILNVCLRASSYQEVCGCRPVCIKLLSSPISKLLLKVTFINFYIPSA